MKAIVCVKQVPDTSGKVAVNPDGTLNRASMATIINPDDKNAVEAALTLKLSLIHIFNLACGRESVLPYLKNPLHRRFFYHVSQENRRKHAHL